MSSPRGGGTARKPLMAGNWKMNLNHLEAIGLLQKLAFSLSDADHDAVECVVLPPFVDLRGVQTLVDGDKLRIRYGAQDLSPYDAGAHTGDVSGPMLAKLGCSYVIVGHSERRQYFGETDETAARRTVAALGHGLKVIACVGESAEERESGQTELVLRLQVESVADAAGTHANLVLAYEPVWAIGTGKTATPEIAQEAHALIKSLLDVPVLYGGSVKPENAEELLSQPGVDGALVGGASLDVESFTAICQVAARFHS